MKAVKSVSIHGSDRTIIVSGDSAAKTISIEKAGFSTIYFDKALAPLVALSIERIAKEMGE